MNPDRVRQSDMIYRTLGNTGLRVSEIGIGTEHLDGKPYEEVEEVIQAAYVDPPAE